MEKLRGWSDCQDEGKSFQLLLTTQTLSYKKIFLSFVPRNDEISKSTYKINIKAKKRFNLNDNEM